MSPREHDFGRGYDQPDEETPPAADPVRVHRTADGFRSGVVKTDDLDGMTKAELLALADERGIEASGTKAEIVAALSAE